MAARSAQCLALTGPVAAERSLMIALEVFVNGRRIALAGAEDLVVLSAIIHAVGKLGTKARGTKENRRGRDLFLSVGGLTGRMRGAADEHLRWTRGPHEELAIGDEVRVRIVRAKGADRPKRRHPATTREDAGREQFEWAKKIYFAERERYEPTAESNVASADAAPSRRTRGPLARRR